MDAFVSYSYGTAGWLALQATPMIISPAIIATLLSPEAHRTTPLEEYFSRSLGLSLFALGALCLALAGVFSGSTDPDVTALNNPYAATTLVITTVYHFFISFYAYGHYVSTQQTSFMFGAIGSGGMAATGVWCILFRSGSRISKRTGADKRTSGWPFGNAAADKKRAPKMR